MQNLRKKICLTAVFLLLTLGMLCCPKQALYFALTGLTLWFDKMIPALLPFMIVSNLLLELHLTDSFVRFLKPVLGRLFRLNADGVYALFVGFLCGFPMGAKVIADLLEKNRISMEDARFLLSFCNNIGPVYFTGFVLLTLHVTRPLSYLFGMYGLPFCYGLILRRLPAGYRPPAARRLSAGYRLPRRPRSGSVRCVACAKKAPAVPTLLDVLDDSILSALQSITKLGGYMIFFNLLNLIPYVLTAPLSASLKPGEESLFLPLAAINCLLEITSGISRLGDACPFLALVLLPFGGFSCIAQTYSMIKDSGLSLSNYIGHKLALTGLTAVYYALLLC